MMRKLFILLLCLTAVWSCEMKGTYYYRNCQDFITLTDGRYVNDYGVVYTLSSTASEQIPLPSVEGNRYFLYFDVLNVNREILLKNCMPVTTLQAVPATETAPDSHDPVNILLYNISPAWMNLNINYYRVKGSEFTHTLSVQYARDPETDIICIGLFHDGNDENPASVTDQSTLEMEAKLLSIPLTGYGWTPTGLNLTCHVLQPKDDGGYEVMLSTYTTND